MHAFSDSQRLEITDILCQMESGFALSEMIPDLNGEAVDFRFLQANDAFGSFVGMGLENIVGQTVRGIFPELDPKWMEYFGEVIRKKSSKNFVDYVSWLNKWVDVNFFWLEGNRFCTVLKEVQAPEKMMGSDLSLSFNAFDRLIFVLKPDGTILNSNGRLAEELGGLSDADHTTSFLSLVDPGSQQEIRELCQNLKQDDFKFLHFPLVGKSGKLHPTNSQFKVGEWNGRRVIVCLSNLLAPFLMEEWPLKRDFIDAQLPLCITTIDNSTILAINQSMRDWLNLPDEKLIGKSLSACPILDFESASDVPLNPFEGTSESITNKVWIDSCGVREEFAVQQNVISINAHNYLLHKFIKAGGQDRSDMARDVVLHYGHKVDHCLMDDILKTCLSEAIRLTESEAGFFYFFDKEQAIINSYLYKSGISGNDLAAEDHCEVPFSLEMSWAQCLKHGRSIIHNNFEKRANDHYPGVTEDIRRQIVFPVIDKGSMRAVLGLVNKRGDYRIDDRMVGDILVNNFWNMFRRKLVEERLRRREERLKLAIKAANQGYWDIDLHHKKVFMSNQVSLIAGYQDDEIVITYDNYASYIHPDDRAGFDEVFLGYLENPEEEIRVEFRLLCADNQYRWQVVKGKETGFNEFGQIIRLSGTIRDIHDRKEAELALSEYRQFSDHLIESAHVMIVGVNHGGLLTMFNKHAQQLTGYSMEEVEGKSWKEMLKPSNAYEKEWDEFIEEFYNDERTTRRFELPLLTKDNQEKLISWSINQVHPGSDDQSHFAFGIDMTQQKELEMAFHESETGYQNLFEASHDALGILDAETLHCIEMNSAGHALFGVDDYASLNHFTSMLRSAVHPERGQRLLEEEAKRLPDRMTNGGRTFRRQFQRPDGRVIACEISLSPMYYKGRDAILAIIGDVSQRDEMERALMTSERELSVIFNSAPVMMMMLNRKCEVQKVNQTGLDFAQVEAEEAIGMRVGHLLRCHKITGEQTFCGELQGCDLCHIYQVIDNTFINSAEYSKEDIVLVRRGRNSELEEIHVQISSRLIIGVDSLAVLLTIDDVSGQKALELDLKKAKEKAEESDRLKSAFLANMSHEIRTPMNGIIGFAELLSEPDLKEEYREQYVEVIRNSSGQLLNIVNDIIDISKIEVGQIDVRRKPVDINAVLDQVFDSLSVQVDTRRVDYRVTNYLPVDKALLLTDPTKITQILTNLVSNAIKFTDSGSIHLGALLVNGAVQLFVKDTGIGIKSHLLDVVFDRFRQADDKLVRRYGGTGLGLAISKAYAEILGGMIGVTSEENKGSTFSVEIPGVFVEQKKEKKEVMLKESRKEHIVLVAEDEEYNFLYIREVLKREPIILLHAKNGEEAVKMAEKNASIEMVLMDVKMPVMDGLEATRRIKEIRSELPIVAQTAFALSGDKDRILAAGCNEYITKPIRREALIEMINRFLS